MEEEKVKGASAGESAARYLESLILEGSLSPGDVLMPERELAQRLQISRPTLREGIRILEEKGLLTTEAGRRSVAPLGSEITGPLTALMAASPDIVDDCLEFRTGVEQQAAELAARRATPFDHERLRQCIERIDSAHAAANARAEAEADADFHVALYEASHNLVLLHVMRSIAEMLRQAMVRSRETLFASPSVREALRLQHHALLDAVLAGNAADAARLAGEHILYTHQALREVAAASARIETSRRRIAGRAVSQRKSLGAKD